MPPPAALRDALAGRAGRASTGTATPTARPPSLRAAIAALHGVDAGQVFAANGSNEVLQTLLLDLRRRRAAPSSSFEPTYALHSHIARITGTDGGRGRARPPTSRSTSTRCAGCSPRPSPAITFLCSPNNPTGHGRGAGDGARACSTLAPGLVVVDEAYGQFAAWSALDLVDDDRAAGRHPHVLQDVVDGRGPPRLPRRARVARRRAREGRAAVPPRRRQAGRRPARPALRDEMDERVAARRGAGAAGRRRWPTLPVDVWPSGANFVLFRPARRPTARRVAGPARPRRARARLLVVASPRRLPAGHHRHARRGRRASSPPCEEVARHDAARRPRSGRTKETTIAVALDLDGTGRDRRARPACRSSTTCSTSSGATAGSTSTCRPTGDLADRRPPHRRGRRHRARRGVPRGAGRQGRRPPLRQRAVTRSTRRWSRSPSTCRAGRSSSTTSTLPEVAAARRPAVRPAAGRALLASFATAAGITLHVTGEAGRNTHHIVEATFKGVARCLRDAVRVEGGGVPSTKGVL